jgi:hypothetical protein
VLVAQWWLRLVAVVVMLAPVLADPPAAAEDKLAFGGGAGIIVDGSYCTLTTIGHDRAGELVGFTAAHCGGPGAQVVAEGSENRGPLGTVVAASNERLDYAVITFDPAKVIPISNFAGFVINGIGPDPEFHQPACKLGAATGDSCSYIESIPSPRPRANLATLFQAGDDGGPVTSDDLLIGMIRSGWNVPGDLQGAPPVIVTKLTLFSAILDDVNANGGPGGGFTPVPA